jgi:hypothetical protein
MHSRQYGKFPGCSVNGKTIVKSFGDGLFIFRVNSRNSRQRGFENPCFLGAKRHLRRAPVR